MAETKPPHYAEVEQCEMLVEKAINALCGGTEGSTRLAATHLGKLEERLQRLRYAIWDLHFAAQPTDALKADGED